MRFQMRVHAKLPAFATFLVVLAIGVLIGASRLRAQEGPPQIKPGPEHEHLKLQEGTWDASIKSMDKESKGVLKCKMALNGLWMMEHFKSEFDGKPFEGIGATTYDPAKKKYVNVWIDSMATSPMVSEGTYDKDTKTLKFVGDMPTPDGKSMKTTMTTVAKDADTKTFTLRAVGTEGKEFEMLQITYARRAK
jgi:hypothetical protein